MIYSIFEVGDKLKEWLSFLAPATLVIIAIIITAAVTKGYKNLIQGIQVIVGSKWTFLFFIVVCSLFIYLWSQLKGVIGW